MMQHKFIVLCRQPDHDTVTACEVMYNVRAHTLLFQQLLLTLDSHSLAAVQKAVQVSRVMCFTALVPKDTIRLACHVHTYIAAGCH